MIGKLTVPYRDRVSTVMSIKKTFEIPAVTVPRIGCNWYGQFPTHTKTALRRIRVKTIFRAMFRQHVEGFNEL